MSNFEEQFAAWTDGKLTGRELEEFEVRLTDRAEAEREKSAAIKLGALLRTHGQAPLLSNAEFFNRQLLQNITATQPAPAPRERPRHSPFALWRMFATGAACLLAAFFLFKATVPHTPVSVPTEREFLAEVIDANPGEGISATTFQSKKDNFAVLWLEGIEYVPEASPAENGN